MTSKTPVFHLFDHRNLRITKRNQTRCGKMDCRPKPPLKGGPGTYLENFREIVHDDPIEGVTYCRGCRLDFQKNGRDG